MMMRAVAPGRQRGRYHRLPGGGVRGAIAGQEQGPVGVPHPYRVRVARGDGDRADLGIPGVTRGDDGVLDRLPARPARRSVGCPGVVRPPQRQPASQYPLRLTGIQHERRDEQRIPARGARYGHRVRDAEGLRFPVPHARGDVDELAIDVPVAPLIRSGSAVGVPAQAQEDVLAVEDAGVGRVGRAPAAVSVEDRRPFLRALLGIEAEGAVVLRAADDLARVGVARARVELGDPEGVVQAGPAALEGGWPPGRPPMSGADQIPRRCRRTSCGCWCRRRRWATMACWSACGDGG